jgi:hypothetical protein
LRSRWRRRTFFGQSGGLTLRSLHPLVVFANWRPLCGFDFSGTIFVVEVIRELENRLSLRRGVYAFSCLMGGFFA